MQIVRAFSAKFSIARAKARTKHPGKVDGLCDTTMWDPILYTFVEKPDVLVRQPAQHRGSQPIGVIDLTLEASIAFLTGCKEQNSVFLMLWFEIWKPL